jgi:hypothetical protein
MSRCRGNRKHTVVLWEAFESWIFHYCSKCGSWWRDRIRPRE